MFSISNRSLTFGCWIASSETRRQQHDGAASAGLNTGRNQVRTSFYRPIRPADKVYCLMSFGRSFSGGGFLWAQLHREGRWRRVLLVFREEIGVRSSASFSFILPHSLLCRFFGPACLETELGSTCCATGATAGRHRNAWVRFLCAFPCHTFAVSPGLIFGEICVVQVACGRGMKRQQHKSSVEQQ